MPFHFVERALEAATGQSFANLTPLDPLPSDIDVTKDQSQINTVDADVEAKPEIEQKIQEWKPQRHEWMVMITLALISLMVAFDATILVPVLPTLAIDLHGTANEALWTGTSYLLTSAVFQPCIAALSDIFGRRELLFPSLLLFTAGTAICCIAHNFAVMLAGRCVQGVGGGGIITLSQVIFADIIPLRQRPKYFSVVLGAWALGSVLGPFIGGLFVVKATWRWCFYINFPFCALGFPMVLLLIPLKTAHTSLKAKLLRVDWLGGVLFIAGLTSALIAITWGGISEAWSSWRTLVPLAVGGTTLFAALIWERHGAIEPFLRHSLFHNVSAMAAYACALLQGLLLFSALYYLPFFLTAVLRKSSLQSGIGLFPATCFLLPGSAVVSQLITRLGRFRRFMLAGWAVSTIGLGLFTRLDANTKTWYWAVCLSVFGLGMGMVLSSVNFATQANAKIRDSGRAAAMYAFCRSLGMAIGVAVCGSIFQNLMAGKLADLGLQKEIAKNAEAYVAILRAIEATDPIRAGQVLSAYVRGFWGIWVLMTGLSGFGFVMSLCIKHMLMNTRLDSQYALDRSGRSSKLLYGALAGEKQSLKNLVVDGASLQSRPQSSSVLLRPDTGAENRQSKVTFSEQPAGDGRSSGPETQAAHFGSSTTSPSESRPSSQPLGEEELTWDGSAKEPHGHGPIWGVS